MAQESHRWPRTECWCCHLCCSGWVHVATATNGVGVQGLRQSDFHGHYSIGTATAIAAFRVSDTSPVCQKLQNFLLCSYPSFLGVAAMSCTWHRPSHDRRCNCCNRLPFLKAPQFQTIAAVSPSITTNDDYYWTSCYLWIVYFSGYYCLTLFTQGNL